MRTFFIVGFFITLVGCSDNATKTESMVRFETAQKEQQALVDKAISILDNQVKDNPIANLEHIGYAREISRDAIDVFEKAKIVGVPQPEIEALDRRLDSYHPAMASHALSLLHNVANQTIALKERLAEIKSMSYSAERDQDIDELVEYLAIQYNDSIKTCCLNDLATISRLLSADNSKQYVALRTFINQAISDQEAILTAKISGEDYRRDIDALKHWD